MDKVISTVQSKLLGYGEVVLFEIPYPGESNPRTIECLPVYHETPGGTIYEESRFNQGTHEKPVWQFGTTMCPVGVDKADLKFTPPPAGAESH